MIQIELSIRIICGEILCIKQHFIIRFYTVFSFPFARHKNK
eukprot:UN22328